MFTDKPPPVSINILRLGLAFRIVLTFLEEKKFANDQIFVVFFKKSVTYMKCSTRVLT